MLRGLLFSYGLLPQWKKSNIRRVAERTRMRPNSDRRTLCGTGIYGVTITYLMLEFSRMFRFGTKLNLLIFETPFSQALMSRQVAAVFKWTLDPVYPSPFSGADYKVRIS